MPSSATLIRTIHAPIPAVFRALSTPIGLLDWCARAADIDPRPGGHVFLWAEDDYRVLGSVTEVESDQLLEWQLLAPERGTLRIEFVPDGESTRLRLIVSSDAGLDAHVTFWNAALDNLIAVLETGLDRRLFDRPMLGILIGGLIDENNQAAFSMPFSYGIIVSGTVEGMGAADAGIRENDVLVEMNDVELRDFYALENALSGFKAGDEIRVAWYRNGALKEGFMTLSGRPEPYVPDNPADLADHVESVYRGLDATLCELLAGASETQTTYRRAENEWNIQEILAHLIANERTAQLWIAAALEGQSLKTWPSNDHALVKAIVDAMPKTSDLLDTLRSTQRETVTLIRRLPPEIITHKGTFTNLSFTLGKHGLALHAQMHFDTIRSLLEESPGK